MNILNSNDHHHTAGSRVGAGKLGPAPLNPECVQESRPRGRAIAGEGAWPTYHWLSCAVFSNVGGASGAPIGGRACLSASVGGQRQSPGPRCSVPGSSKFHSQAGPGSGARADSLCPPVAVLKPRRTYSRSVTGRPRSPSPGRGACVGRRSGAWSPPGPLVKDRERGKGFGPQAGVRMSTPPHHV